MVCLIIVSTPGPHFVKVKARFGQFGDEYGQGFIHYMAKLVTRLARSKTRLVKARARSLTIIVGLKPLSPRRDIIVC